MSQSLEGSFHPSSPHSSSGGAESFKGTPDTRLTAFSPDESSARSSKLLRNISHIGRDTTPVRFPVTSYRGSTSQLDKDPFLTTSPPLVARPSQKLSPTASAFRPFLVPTVATSQNTTDEELAARGQATQPVSSSLSTDLGLSRHLIIASASEELSTSDLEFYFSRLEQLGLLYHGTRQAHRRGDQLSVSFSDIRDACLALSNVRLAGSDWEARYISTLEYAKAMGPTAFPGMAQTAQVSVVAISISPLTQDSPHAEAVVLRLLQLQGQLFAFKKQIPLEDGTFRAIAEFCDQAAASTAVVNCGNALVDGIHITVCGWSAETQPTTDDGLSAVTNASRASPSSRDVVTMVHGLSLQTTQLSPNSRGSIITPGARQYPPLGVQVHPTYPMYPLLYQSPFQPGISYIMDPANAAVHAASPGQGTYQTVRPVYQPLSPFMHLQSDYSRPGPPFNYGRVDSRRQNAARISRSPYYNAASHHNHVDIMLRNIPNKVDQAMLKRIVDESSWGKYDFMYLRIDFANDCNVGYAFINFVDPLDIIDFVDTRGNQRWYNKRARTHTLAANTDSDRNCFKSDKVAEISYATIQGKDCLVQKFRNSSVMLEAAHYRPKLYFTSNGPMPDLAGQEEPFPEPDNQSKMKRSCENAEHVGLFTPNAGQHFRDEQRRRRSQYDRGTRLAALEEYDYETSTKRMYAPQ